MGLEGTILTMAASPPEIFIRITGLTIGDKGQQTLDELGGLLNRFTSTTINLLDELGELASNVGSVAVEDWSISVSNLARVVHENHLSVERLGALGGVVLRVTSNVAT
jgi:hypothetical protein